MKHLLSGALLVACVVVAPVLASDAPPTAPAVGAVAATFSVGQFAVELAKSLNLKAPESEFTPDSAAWALWQNGVRIRPDLDRDLTEADVAATMQQLGFSLTASNPAKTVPAEKAGLVLNTFVNSSTIQRLRQKGTPSVSAAGNGGDDFNNGNGKGGKFKRKGGRSPNGGGDGL